MRFFGGRREGHKFSALGKPLIAAMAFDGLELSGMNAKLVHLLYFRPTLEGLAFRLLESVVVDGNVTTSRGLGTAVDFALSLIGQLLGEKKADEIAESVVYSRK